MSNEERLSFEEWEDGDWAALLPREFEKLTQGTLLPCSEEKRKEAISFLMARNYNFLILVNKGKTEVSQVQAKIQILKLIESSKNQGLDLKILDLPEGYLVYSRLQARAKVEKVIGAENGKDQRAA